MTKVSVRSVFSGKEARSVQEALEVLRGLWKEDATVRNHLTKAAREGYVLVDTKDMPTHLVAALRTALARLQERLGEEKPSTLLVKPGKGKEERKPMTWESPEGVRYVVHPYDLTPREERYWGFRDQRVQEALAWVERFLANSEVEEGPSLLEEALEREENPHFRREIIPPDLEGKLRTLGWKGALEELIRLVDGLPAREKELKQAVESIAALVDPTTKEVVALKTPSGWEVRGQASKRVMKAVVSLDLLRDYLQGEWSTGDARRLAQDVEPYAPGLVDRLEAIAALRQAAYLLKQYGRRPKVAVYRDLATGEPVLRAPVLG